ncbi:MAG: MBL fold metallo-hydrolase [Mailhella sp.]|nr:MBL fold metallo-hydrolase [Mailhella sp.]
MAECISIDKDTWRIEDGGVRFFLLCGTERALLLDTGMNVPDAKEFAQRLTDLPILLMNTHGDPDHISGNRAFPEFFMSPAEEENYRSFGGTGQLLPVRDGDTLDLGERPLLILDNPGHTPGSIAVLDEKNKVLYGGDAIQDGNVFLFGKYRNVSRYARSLARLAAFAGRYDVIYPCHGSFPVYPELIPKLLEGIGAVMEGKADGIPTEMHGRKVMLYKFPYAGFFCDMAAE